MADGIRSKFEQRRDELNKGLQDVYDICACNEGIKSSNLQLKDKVEAEFAEKVTEVAAWDAHVFPMISSEISEFEGVLKSFEEKHDSWTKFCDVLEIDWTPEERETNFKGLSTDWSSLWSICTILIPEMRTTIDRLSTQFTVGDNATRNTCKNNLSTAETNARMVLKKGGLLVFQHPNPVLRVDKKGEIKLRMMKNGIFKPEIIKITLVDTKDSSTITAWDHTICDLKELKKECLFFSDFPNDWYGAIIGFNGAKHVLKIKDNKRKQKTGASLKLYQIQFTVKFIVVDTSFVIDTSPNYFTEIYETHPFAITTNASQNPEPWASIFWNRSFEALLQVSWSDFFLRLSSFFEVKTGRGLDSTLPGYENYQESCLKQELQKQSPDTISFKDLLSLDFRDQGSKWQWIYSYILLLEGKYGEVGQQRGVLQTLWKEGKIWGFVTHEMENKLYNSSSGNCLLRFRATKPGCIVFTMFLKDEKRIVPFNWSKEELNQKKKDFFDLLYDRIDSLGEPFTKNKNQVNLIYLQSGQWNEIKIRPIQEIRKILQGQEVQQLPTPADADGYISGHARNETILPYIKKLIEEGKRTSGIYEEEDSNHASSPESIRESVSSLGNGDMIPVFVDQTMSLNSESGSVTSCVSSDVNLDHGSLESGYTASGISGLDGFNSVQRQISLSDVLEDIIGMESDLEFMNFDESPEKRLRRETSGDVFMGSCDGN